MLVLVRIRVVLLALLCLASAGAAVGAAYDRGWQAPAPVTALDQTASGVATALAWTPQSCEAVVLWQPAYFARRTFRVPGPCPQTSTGRSIASVATDFARVVWLAYVGGNTREWTLWTATPTARKPRRLRFASADVDAPAPIVLGNGDETGIPYAVGPDVVVIGHRGKRALSWHAPGRVVALAVGAGSVGALLETGQLEVVSLFNRVDLDYPPAAVRAFRIAAVGAVVETRTGIEVRTARRTAHLPVPAGATLVGYADGELVYALRDQIRAFFRSDGRDVRLRRVRPPFRAEFDRRGMAWVTGRRVCWAVRVYVSPVSHGSC
jgi:hypothetical protein